MSLDNVIATVAVADGDLTLLALGLALSIPLIVAGAALIVTLLDRSPLLIWAGAALLGWIAGGVIAADPVLRGYLTEAFSRSVAQRSGKRGLAARTSYLPVSVLSMLKRPPPVANSRTRPPAAARFLVKNVYCTSCAAWG